MSNTILITKPKTVSAVDKFKLAKAGFTLIEHPEPHTGIKFRIENEYVYTNCCQCGERIYMLPERLSTLKMYKKTFYCTQGHSQSYT